jgi:D-glucosaminate-6-phosphate ammonia-lyase
MSSDIVSRLKLQRIINVSGTMTSLGAARVVPEVAARSVEILDHFVDIDQLQARASAAIAQATGAEAGCVTSSAASGVSVAIAAAMTGPDLERIERLPDTSGLKNEIIIQTGHLINYGAPIEQAIRFTGAKMKRVGNDAERFVSGREAAGLYVVSHHVVEQGLPLSDFIRICKARQVPVIVDMASEYDLKGPAALGADIAIYSAHKFLGGLTAGIMAGKRDLIRAAYLQNNGIGRHMKVGKEGIAGAIAALESWSRRDHQAVRESELGIVAMWLSSLAKVKGLRVEREPDWTGNPIDRVRVTVGEEAGLFAWELADRLAGRDPSVRVRDDLIEQGYFFLDPCNLLSGEENIVVEAIVVEIEAAQARNDGRKEGYEEHRKREIARLLEWPEGF